VGLQLQLLALLQCSKRSHLRPAWPTPKPDFLQHWPTVQMIGRRSARTTIGTNKEKRYC